MKNFPARMAVIALIAAATLCLVAAPARAEPISSTDLWEGASVWSTTGGVKAGSDLRNMFGGNYGTVEAGAGRTILVDGHGVGYVHDVQWQTSSAVTLASFSLHLASDGSLERGVSYFELYGWDYGTSSYSLLFGMSLGYPYSSTTVTAPNARIDTEVAASNFLNLVADVGPFTTDRFLAYFVQSGGTTSGGPRIEELDGFDHALVNPVPEPGSLGLLGLGLLCLVARRRWIQAA